MDVDMIECPVCLSKFGKEKIEKHVNSCLNFTKEKPATRKGRASPNAQTFFEKKVKRKRAVKSPNSNHKDKKQCLGSEQKVNGPPLPSIPLLNEDEMNSSMESIKSQTASLQSPRNSFQETLLKWSQKSSSVTDEPVSDDKDIVEVFSKNVVGQNDTTNLRKQTENESMKIDVKKKLDNESAAAQVNVVTNSKNPKENILNNSKHPKLKLGVAPLAEQMRPSCFDEYFGQVSINSNNMLKNLIHQQNIPSLLLWGPPGCGKTSLAHIISRKCKEGKLYRFVTLSATMAGVSDVKEAVKVAKNERKLTKRQTVLFIDEVHRFNKLQQDTFLPHVEDGTIVLIGATTENPSFHLNNALLSRCKLVVLSHLNVDAIMKILKNAVLRLNGIVEKEEEKEENLAQSSFILQSGVLKAIADLASGDARAALNTLELVVQAKQSKNSEATTPYVLVTDIKEELERGYIKYDRNGDEHYDVISALHKSIRGGDENATLYWLARMLEGGEQPLYIARRLVRVASEDIGLANPSALTQAVSAYQACHLIGMPECDVILAQAATYLARSPKSIEVYEAYTNAKQSVRSQRGPQPAVPLHLRNAPTKMMKNLGYGVGYKYTPKCLDDPQQEYLPAEMKGKVFFEKDG